MNRQKYHTNVKSFKIQFDEIAARKGDWRVRSISKEDPFSICPAHEPEPDQNQSVIAAPEPTTAAHEARYFEVSNRNSK